MALPAVQDVSRMRLLRRLGNAQLKVQGYEGLCDGGCDQWA